MHVYILAVPREATQQPSATIQMYFIYNFTSKKCII